MRGHRAAIDRPAGKDPLTTPPANSQPPQPPAARREAPPAGSNLVAVGAGGNIGSCLWPHLVRTPGVGAVTVIDRDHYECKNLSSQNIRPTDVGRPKARVVAEGMGVIDPDLPVEAIVAAVEDVPLARLRAEVMLTCLDSRGARRWVNRAVRRLGIPWWIDAGVERDGLLARVNVYRFPDSPCYECGWSDADYATLDADYPCQAGDQPAPTDAPSALGALAASLQALELGKILAGDLESVAAGKQVTISAAYHKHFLTSLRTDPSCRCAHEAWEIELLDASPGRLTIGDALELYAPGRGRLSVKGKSFIRELVCGPCRRQRSLLVLQGRVDRLQQSCDGCGHPMEAAGFSLLDHLSHEVLSPPDLGLPLASIGFRPGDVFSLDRGGGEVHYEIGG